MDRSKLAKYILLFLALPFAAYLLINCIAGYIPPTESYKKTPDQFEEAFNEQMAQYGMSIDVDNGEFSKDEDRLKKIVQVVCEDRSKITCTYFPTTESRKALLHYIVFEQELTGEKQEKIYLEPLLSFLMDEFETGMTKNKDESFEPITSVSYNEALRLCREFVEGEDKKMKFWIACAELDETSVVLTRKTDEATSLSVSLFLFDFQLI